MNRTFEFKQNGWEMGRFSLSITKKDGITYSYISGMEPCWQDVVCVAALMIDGSYVPKKHAERIATTHFSVRRNTYVDTRANPLISMEREFGSKRVFELPLTIDGDRILEHFLHISFMEGVEILLATVMQYSSDDGRIHMSPKMLETFDKRRYNHYDLECLKIKGEPSLERDFAKVVETEKRRYGEVSIELTVLDL